jgi:hypothetical protein
MTIDTSRWSGEGDFTQVVVDALQGIDEIAEIRVEDAPASRAESGYNFISNEIYVGFTTTARTEPIRRFGILPGRRTVDEKTLTIDELGARLEHLETVGAADYRDAGMIQYLRTERIVPPYQTRGIKVVELVRIYETGSAPRG